MATTQSPFVGAPPCSLPPAVSPRRAAFADACGSTDRRDPPAPPLALSSNNPFRKAAALATPAASTPPLSPQPDHTMQRQKSTNPFLDDYRAPAASPPHQPRPRSRSPPKPRSAALHQPMASTQDLFAGLSLLDKPARPAPAGASLLAGPPQPRPQPSRDTIRSQADSDRRRMAAGKERGPPPSRQFDIFANPPRDETRRPRPRRNSESSIMDVHDEDRKRQEKERRRRDAKARGAQPGKPSRRLDLIDKLDLTNIYGPGSFHHDGPFDACNPHRNRKGRKHTPMSAFPEGSANNTMGGSGPVSRVLDYDRFHGRATDAYHDWNSASQAAENNLMARKPAAVAPQPAVEPFDSRTKVELVHGEESAGLGTSTFFEGTAVPTKVLQQRRESRLDSTLSAGPGLQRKKSLAQKIRGMSKGRPAGPGERSVHSPDNIDEAHESDPTSPIQVRSAGGRVTNENSPFFSEFGTHERSASQAPDAAADAAKGTTIKITEPTVKPMAGGRARAGSETQAPRRHSLSNGHGRTKSRSSDSSTDDYGLGPTGKQPAGGFLNRVRSLKSKRRPERSAA